MNQNKKIDLIILIIYPLIAGIFSYILKINMFFSVLIFFGIPSLYLTIKSRKIAKRAIIFSILISFPFIIIIDFIEHFTNQWIVLSSILPKIFRYVTIEVIIWAIFNFYFVIMFYEYFVHNHFIKKTLNPRVKYLFLFSLFLFFIFLIFYTFAPHFLLVKYFYLRYGLVVILIPIILQFIKYPKFIFKFTKVAIYFFYVSLVYEIMALKLNWWDFPGRDFIGWVSIYGFRFPLEEFIFWLLLFAMSILTFYEYFDNEEK